MKTWYSLLTCRGKKKVADVRKFQCHPKLILALEIVVDAGGWRRVCTRLLAFDPAFHLIVSHSVRWAIQYGELFNSDPFSFAGLSMVCHSIWKWTIQFGEPFTLVRNSIWRASHFREPFNLVSHSVSWAIQFGEPFSFVSHPVWLESNSKPLNLVLLSLTQSTHYTNDPLGVDNDLSKFLI